MPPASGAKPGAALRGLTQMTRWASRRSRAICSPSRTGSARSQPSETITTTAPRAIPRRPSVSRNSLTDAPIRVPPEASGDADMARLTPDSRGPRASDRVTGCSRVANT